MAEEHQRVKEINILSESLVNYMLHCLVHSKLWEIRDLYILNKNLFSIIFSRIVQLYYLSLKNECVSDTCLQKRRKPMEYVLPHRQQVP